MADDNRAVIIDVDVETKDFDKEIGNVNTELRKNREEIKELSKDYEDNAAEIAKLEATNRNLSKSKKELIKDSKNQSNSLNALRSELSKQTAERNNLNTSTKEGQIRFQELQKSIKGLSDKTKEAEEAGGDFRRSVGEYPKLLGNAVGGIKVFGTSLSDVFKVVAANPIGLIVTAVTSLIAVFAKSQTGIEFFRTAGAALNIVLAKLSDIVEATGAALINAFSEPQKTLDDLTKNVADGIGYYFSEFIPNAIQKVVDGFGLLGTAAAKVFEGDFTGALETATEATGLLVDGVTDIIPATALVKTATDAATSSLIEFASEVAVAAVAATGLEAAMIANEKAQADLEVTRARSIKQLKELNLVIEDTTAGDEERLAAAQEAAEIENALLEERVRLKQEEIEIIVEQNDLANSTEEDIQARRDAEIEFYNLQAESLERSVTLQNKENAIRAQIAAKGKKARDKEQKELDKNALAEKKRKDQDAKDAKKLRAKKDEALTGGVNDLANALGTESSLGKAAALTAIAVNTAKGISGAIAAGSSLPFPANLGAIASGVAAVISGISSAKSALSGGSSAASVSSSVSSGESASSSVSTSQVNQQAQEQRDQTIAQGQAVAQAQPTQQVSVTDINDAQEDRDTVVSDSTL